jgi:hypothetical protein
MMITVQFAELCVRQRKKSGNHPWKKLRMLLRKLL